MRGALRTQPTQPTCVKHTQTLRTRVGSESRVDDEQQRLVDKHRFSRVDIAHRHQAYASPRYLNLSGRPHGQGSGGVHNNYVSYLLSFVVWSYVTRTHQYGWRVG